MSEESLRKGLGLKKRAGAEERGFKIPGAQPWIQSAEGQVVS